MSLNWNFQGCGGFQTKKNLHGGSMDIFWNNTMKQFIQKEVIIFGYGSVSKRSYMYQRLLILLPWETQMKLKGNCEVLSSFSFSPIVLTGCL